LDGDADQRCGLCSQGCGSFQPRQGVWRRKTLGDFIKIFAMANVIRIPLPRSGETLVIRSYELSETITSILRSERVPLEIWMDCARGFLAEGKLEEYTNLLLAVKAEEENQRWNGSSRDKFVPIQALCSLADLKLQEARLAEDEKTRSELLNKAQKLYLQAQNLDVLEMLPQLGLGEISLMNVRFTAG
jgi:hypothetical protein